MESTLTTPRSITISPESVHTTPPASPTEVVDIQTLLHPLFSSSDTDIILGAKDGTQLFRVHSHVLKITSGWFRGMFELPQSPYKNASTSTQSQSPAARTATLDDASAIIYLTEDALTLEMLLRMCSGMVPLLPTTYDDLDRLITAAEKYDMPGPIAILRLLCMTPLFTSAPENSLRLYALSCRFGWEEETHMAVKQSLVLDLHSSIHRQALSHLSTSALLDLISLHRSRREILRARLNDPPFVEGGTALCTLCGSLIDYHTWRELKYKIILEMDVRPLGDRLERYLDEWDEARTCWEAVCSNPECDRTLYDRTETLRVIKECVDSLPDRIGWEDDAALAQEGMQLITLS